jgi:hypothetical protein
MVCHARIGRCRGGNVVTDTDTCAICGAGAAYGQLVGWFVDGARRRVHTACWIRSYEESRAREGGDGAGAAVRMAAGFPPLAHGGSIG